MLSSTRVLGVHSTVMMIPRNGPRDTGRSGRGRGRSRNSQRAGRSSAIGGSASKSRNTSARGRTRGRRQDAGRNRDGRDSGRTSRCATGRGEVEQNEGQLSPWQHSKAKKKAIKLLDDPNSYVHDMDPLLIHANDDDFRRYRADRFKDNFTRLKTTMYAAKKAITFDSDAFARERRAFPRNPISDRGYLRWDGHIAQKQLAQDVKNNLFEGLKPIDIHARKDRPYNQFPLEVFRKHLYQERRKQLEAVAWQDCRNKKGYKKYLQESKEEASTVNASTTAAAVDSNRTS